MSEKANNHQSTRHRRIYINERIPLIEDELRECRQKIKSIPVLRGGKPEAHQVRQYAVRIYNIQRVIELKAEKERIISERNNLQKTLRKMGRSAAAIEELALEGIR